MIFFLWLLLPRQPNKHLPSNQDFLPTFPDFLPTFFNFLPTFFKKLPAFLQFLPTASEILPRYSFARSRPWRGGGEINFSFFVQPGFKNRGLVCEGQISLRRFRRDTLKSRLADQDSCSCSDDGAGSHGR